MSLILSGTDGLSDVDGSAATPAIRGTDANTGIFFPAADTIAFAEGGVEAMRLDSSGNLGLGVTPNITSLGGTYALLAVGKASGSGIIMGQTDLTAADSTAAQFLGKTTGASGYQLLGGMLVQTDGSSTTNAVGRLTFYTATGGSLSERARIDSSGNLLVGTTSVPSPVANYRSLVVGGSTGGIVDIGTTSTSYGRVSADSVGLNVESLGATTIIFRTNSAERARIDSSGNLLVGATSTLGSTAGILVANGGANVQALTTNSTSSSPYYIGRFYSGGTEKGYIYFDGTNVSYTNLSDYRLKDDVQPMQNALDKVAQLNPVTYNWKANGKAGQGFIAHELQAVIPDCVTGEKDAVETQQYEISPAVPATFDEDGNELTPAIEAVMGEREVPKYQGVDTSFLVATLTAAMQEMKALIDTQASTITQLTARITALESA